MQTNFTTTDILALVGAITGTIGTVAGVAALAWDVYKWKHSGPALRVTVQKDMYARSHDKEVKEPDGPHLLIKVVNTGQLKTVIEDVSLAYFETRWSMWTRWDRFTFSSLQATGVTPHTLEPGERWFTAIPQHSKFEEMMQKGYLCVVVFDSLHPRPMFVRVKRYLYEKYMKKVYTLGPLPPLSDEEEEAQKALAASKGV